jgi:hypothetical protein
MNTYFRRAITFAIVVLVTSGLAATALAADGALRLPVTGTVKAGGEFAGTFTVNRFAVENNNLVAIGFLSGVITKGNKPVVTFMKGEVSLPVTLRSAAAFESNARFGVTPTQITCPILQIALGPHDVNLLGFQIALGAVSLEIGGEEGTPLGGLVCSILRLLENVTAVVDLLNSLLGLLTGLLGGLVPAV